MDEIWSADLWKHKGGGIRMFLSDSSQSVKFTVVADAACLCNAAAAAAAASLKSSFPHLAHYTLKWTTIQPKKPQTLALWGRQRSVDALMSHPLVSPTLHASSKGMHDFILSIYVLPWTIEQSDHFSMQLSDWSVLMCCIMWTCVCCCMVACMVLCKSLYVRV